MSDILSQAEIDELLNALTAGDSADTPPEPAAAQIDAKIYDFKTANKFQKEQMRTLNIVFETFAQLLANKLSGVMRTTCECEVLSVEEQVFNEFNNSLPIPVILAMLRMPPLRGSLLMSVSPEVAYTMVNRLLGGDTKVDDSSKQFTEIELALVGHVLRQMLAIFVPAWEKVIRVDVQLERIETSPQFAQIVALSETVAIVILNLTIGESSGLISICLPHAAIEPIAGQLNTLLWFSNSQEGSGVEYKPEQITERLMHADVTLTAYFQDTPATVSDILNLQVGDVIRLNQQIQQPILVKVQHIPKFHAQIGSSGTNFAVRLVDIIKGENQDEF